MSNTQVEYWRDVVGYEGLYQVSNLGRVKSITRYKKLIYQQLSRGQYYTCQLWRKGKCKMMYVHRLVAMAFCPNPENLPIINHKDENKLNNNADNLEWCTHKYNINYGSAIQRRTEHTDYSKINHEHLVKYVQAQRIPVLQIKNGIIVNRFSSISEAAKTLGKSNISNIAYVCRKKRKHAYGYDWEYEGSENY